MWLYVSVILLLPMLVAMLGFFCGLLWHDSLRPFEGNSHANFHGFYCMTCHCDYGAEGRVGRCPRCGSENFPLNF